MAKNNTEFSVSSKSQHIMHVSNLTNKLNKDKKGDQNGRELEIHEAQGTNSEAHLNRQQDLSQMCLLQLVNLLVYAF